LNELEYLREVRAGILELVGEYDTDIVAGVKPAHDYAVVAMERVSSKVKRAEEELGEIRNDLEMSKWDAEATVDELEREVEDVGDERDELKDSLEGVQADLAEELLATEKLLEDQIAFRERVTQAFDHLEELVDGVPDMYNAELTAALENHRLTLASI